MKNFRNKKVFKDFSGYVFLYMRRFKLHYFSVFCTLITKIKLNLLGIPYGKLLKITGIPRINRAPFSTISIGSSCLFLSDTISNRAGINRKCSISTLSKGARIIIGDNCGFSGTVIGAAEFIEIGDNVIFGVNAFVTDFDWHNVDPNTRKDPCNSKKPVVIKDNVWLGANSVVLKGVTIGENSVIGANSVVVKDIPPNVVAGGNPCKPLKNLQA